VTNERPGPARGRGARRLGDSHRTARARAPGVCLDEALVGVAAERGHEIFAGDPHQAAFAPAGAALSVDFPLVLRPELIDLRRGDLEHP